MPSILGEFLNARIQQKLPIHQETAHHHKYSYSQVHYFEEIQMIFDQINSYHIVVTLPVATKVWSMNKLMKNTYKLQYSRQAFYHLTRLEDDLT